MFYLINYALYILMILGIMVLLIAENFKNKQSIEMKDETGKTLIRSNQKETYDTVCEIIRQCCPHDENYSKNDRWSH